jgi:proline racemase
MEIQTVDYHTAGEPFRIVASPMPRLVGSTVLERRACAMRDLDAIRRLLVNEPRGHSDMYGCFVTPPNDDDADLGVVFFHNAGYSTACGHGTIALVTWALESCLLDSSDGRVIVDVPSGRLATVARVEAGRVRSVRFRNVPAYVVERAIPVQTPFGSTSADVSYGGAFYASVPVTTLGLEIRAAALPDLITTARAIKPQLENQLTLADPVEPEINGLYGVIFHEDAPGADGMLTQRNVTVFADGEVDRSPCGSGTSARLALLCDAGTLAVGEDFRNIGIAGGAFLATAVELTSAGGRSAVLTEVEGSAHLTGYHTFVLQPDDPLETGFLLR